MLLPRTLRCSGPSCPRGDPLSLTTRSLCGHERVLSNSTSVAIGAGSRSQPSCYPGHAGSFFWVPVDGDDGVTMGPSLLLPVVKQEGYTCRSDRPSYQVFPYSPTNRHDSGSESEATSRLSFPPYLRSGIFDCTEASPRVDQPSSSFVCFEKVTRPCKIRPLLP